MPQIYVDADACPVKDEVIKVAARHKVHTTFVANGGLRPSRDPMVKNHIVPQGADAADDWIAEMVQEDDVVVTADIPLAARCLEKNAHVLGPTGKPFTKDSIGMALAMRDLNQTLRESGDIAGYNRAFSQKDRSSFLQALENTLQKVR